MTLVGAVIFGPVSATWVNWSSPVQITDGAWNSGTYYMQPQAFMDGSDIYLVWMDGRDNLNQDYDLYFTSSQDSGASWQTEKRISTLGEYASNPAVVAYNDHVHAFVTQNGTMWYLNSSDGGSTWGTKNLTFRSNSISDYEAAIDGSTVYLVWSESIGLTLDYDLYMLKSTDSGTSWSTPDKIVEIQPSSGLAFVDVETYGDRVYVVSDGGFIRSDDRGENWGSLDANMNGIDVETDGQYVHLMTGTGYGAAGYTRSGDFGDSWLEVDTALEGKIAITGNYVYIIDITQYFISNDKGDSFEGPGTIPDITPVSSYYHSICSEQPGKVHIFFEEWLGAVDHTEIFYASSDITLTAPSTPSDLEATSGDGYVLLTWKVPSSSGGSSITNYKIYRGTGPGNETYLATVGDVLVYKISAVNDIGEGAKTDAVTSTPTNGTTTPPTREKSILEELWFWLLIVVIIVFIVIILLFWLMRKKKEP
jgi:hypothetical protein